MELQQNNHYDNNQTFNATSIAYRITGFIFTFTSFLGVVADRFLAIQLHLGYQELVIHKRVVAVVISTWVLSAIIRSMFDYWNLGDVFKVILGIFSTACIITITFFNQFQNICSRTTPCTSNPSPSSTTSSIEWRIGECWEGEKNRCHYSLRLCCVFGL